MPLSKVIFSSYLFLVSIIINAQSLESTFAVAKDNKADLELVLNHYKKLQDQQKFNAAQFLIENMRFHYSVDYAWVDENGTNINFDETTYEDIEVAKKAFKNISNNNKIVPQRIKTYDANALDKNLLIENIDLAFDAWLNHPWSTSYNYETFIEYILPYRSHIEPLQDWRSEYKLLYERIGHEVIDKSDPVEVCSKIINEIKHFDFELERYDPSPLLGPMELLFWREGNCPDLANVCIFACRALGVAVTFDFTPYFAASSNKHFWNTVVNNEGEHIPFNGNQVLPYVYNANYRRMGKVFRYTFSEQRDNLPFLIAETQIPDDFLKSRHIIDVTKEYVDVSEITYSFKNQGDLSLGYLNVFNTGKWRVIDWAQMNGQSAVFSDMGRDIVYLPGVYKNKTMVYEPYPLLLDKAGKLIILKPDFKNTFTATLSRKNETSSEYEDNNPFDIGTGKNITLYVWNGTWQVVEKKISKNYQIIFNKMPENGLFLMASDPVDSFERIFTVDKETNKITWY